MATEALEKFGMKGWHPTFVIDAGANVRAGMDKLGVADWCRCCCHLMHNAVIAGMDYLEDLARHPTWDNRVWNALVK